MARIIVHIITMAKQPANASSGPAPQGDGAPEIEITEAMVEAGVYATREHCLGKVSET
jgi:hypothetical protein